MSTLPQINQDVRILVTGATGYVGGRLVPRLLEKGYQVRVLIRGRAERLNGRPWSKSVEIATGDVLKPETLVEAMTSVEAAYYLIHSMTGNDEFSERDVQAAHNFGDAASKAGVSRIIYLGGLGDAEGELSEHLKSRQETGAALRGSGLPVTEFRAGMVVGSGSLSFEMVRHLTERLPAMICPKWVFSRSHPIAIRDILSYLISALEVPESRGEIIEVGGADILTYADMMKIYAKVRELKRYIIPVPVLSPRLSSYWAHWVTPIQASIVRPLIEGLKYELVADTTLARKLFPEIEPIDYETAVELALRKIEEGHIESIWSDAIASNNRHTPPVYLTSEQGMLIERRRVTVQASEESVYKTFTGLGGRRGWPPYTWLWKLRGLLDRMVGGVGMRRGRRHPDDLRVGEALDFWRVEALEPGRMMRLRAEMKLPGRGWLQYEVDRNEQDEVELIQTAYFAPKGLSGLIYWYGIYPLHGLIFSKTVDSLAKVAEMSELTGEDLAASSSASLLDRAAHWTTAHSLKVLAGTAVVLALIIMMVRRMDRETG